MLTQFRFPAFARFFPSRPLSNPHTHPHVPKPRREREERKKIFALKYHLPLTLDHSHLPRVRFYRKIIASENVASVVMLEKLQ